MKKGYFVLYALMMLNVIITVIFVFFMPDEVPLHFSLAGEADRIGSKYENFIMPLLAIGVGVFLILIAKFGEKDNEQVMIKINIGMQLFMIVLAVFLFSSKLSFDAAEPSSLFDLATAKFASIGFGVLLIVSGNMMPKSNMNSTFGIRTSWSMSSEETWQKTQRFGGYTCIVSGLIMIIFGILFNGLLATASMLAIATVCCLVCVAASYKIYKDAPEEDNFTF